MLCSLAVIQVIKLTETGWTCSMSGVRGGAYRMLVGNLRVRGHLKNLGLDGKILLMDLQEVSWAWT